jgi:hypothetical protein
MRRTLAFATALALGLSACGAAQSEPETEQEKVTKVVDALAKAGSRRDAERICTEILAKQLVAELKTAGGDCVAEMDRAIKDATDYDLQVVSVKVTGANATARVRQGDDGAVATFTFVKEGKAWKAAALGT